MLWFAVGALTYAAGTVTGSWTTLFGWNEAVFRAWYIAGALMGGAPLAQGSVYLHVKRRTADWLSVALVLAIATASVFVRLRQGQRSRTFVRRWQEKDKNLTGFAEKLSKEEGGAVVECMHTLLGSNTRNRKPSCRWREQQVSSGGTPLVFR